MRISDMSKEEIEDYLKRLEKVIEEGKEALY